MTCPCPSICPPAQPIVCATREIVRDFFHPQIVPVIHPIRMVNRHHCCPILKHIYTTVHDKEVTTCVNINGVKGKKLTAKGKKLADKNTTLASKNIKLTNKNIKLTSKGRKLTSTRKK